MSSDSENSESHISSDQGSSSETDAYYDVSSSQYAPYEDEPLAEVDENNEQDEENFDEEADIDGLTPSVLEARYERTVTVDSW